MSKASTKVYLIAGATRGIGLALVADIADKDSSAFIYAGARDSISAGSSKLKDLAAKYPGRIEVVKYVAGDKQGNDTLARKIEEKHGHVDTVIANAGISDSLTAIHETPVSKFQNHFAINTLGPIVLFQSVCKLLKASEQPCFVPIRSLVGSISLISDASMAVAPYGVSKAALNWVTRKIHFENNWLVAFPICPGPVDTDMTQIARAEDQSGKLESLTFRSASSAAGALVDIIAVSTREKDGGLFHNLEGTTHPW